MPLSTGWDGCIGIRPSEPNEEVRLLGDGLPLKTKRPETFVPSLSITMIPQRTEARINPYRSSVEAPGFPVSSTSNRAGDGSPSLLESSVLQRSLAASLRVSPASHFCGPALRRLRGSPRIGHLPAMLPAQESGLQVFPFPGFLESPIPVPSAAPAADPRVSPAFAPSDAPGDLAPGLPGAFCPPALPASSLQVSLKFSPPAQPAMLLQVSPNPASSGCAASASSSVPESCFHGWVDDDFLTGLELCILEPRSRMNLRVLPGLAHSCQTLDAFSI